MSSPADYLAVCRLSWCYAQAVDRRDYAQFEQIFTADAVQEIPHFPLTLNGIEEITEAMKKIEMYDATYHTVHNQLYDLQDSTGSGETYTQASHFSTDEQGRRTCYVMGIRYRDTVVRDAGQWRLSHRLLLLDWEDTRLLGQQN